jgi:single-stranded-DNA-specific exonuclease
MAALGLEERGAVVVTAAEGWHPGVVGLVAAG